MVIGACVQEIVPPWCIPFDMEQDFVVARGGVVPGEAQGLILVYRGRCVAIKSDFFINILSVVVDFFKSHASSAVEVAC